MKVTATEHIHEVVVCWNFSGDLRMMPPTFDCEKQVSIMNKECTSTNNQNLLGFLVGQKWKWRRRIPVQGVDVGAFRVYAILPIHTIFDLASRTSLLCFFIYRYSLENVTHAHNPSTPLLLLVDESLDTGRPCIPFPCHRAEWWVDFSCMVASP